jgi:membrane protein implicated in regulation of membrane protease activity
MNWWIWVLAGFLLLFLELASATLHVGFFAAGAFLVGILNMAGWDAPLWQELLVFTVTSLVAFFFIRPIVMKKLKLNREVVVDSIAGEQAVALEDMAVAARGKAELRGATWSAQNVGTTPLVRGQRCTVERVEGLLLHIRA